MDIELKCRERSRYKKLCSSQAQAQAEDDIIVPDTMEDILRIICCRHQCRIKEKNVTSDRVSVIGELNVTILYVPESGTGVRSIETQLPIEANFEAAGADSTCVCITQVINSAVDAKAANPRKISLSAVVTMDQCCYKYVDFKWYQPPESRPDKLFFRENELNFAEVVFTGEKNLGIEDELQLPDELSGAAFIKAFASLGDCGSEIVGSKLVVKGSCDIEALYTLGDVLRTCSFRLPFSQLFTLPDDAPSPDTGITMMLTGQHYEAFGDKLSVDIRAAAQIVCIQEQSITYISDAYSCRKQLDIEKSCINIAKTISNKSFDNRLSLSYSSDYGVQSVVSAYASVGCIERSEDGSAAIPVTAEVIYVDGEGSLRACRVRGRAEIDAQKGDIAVQNVSVSAVSEGDKISVTVIISAVLRNIKYIDIEMVSGIAELDADVEKPNANVFMCAADDDLWEIAKKYYSDISLIKTVNSIDDEIPDRLLLIPVV